MSKTRILIIEDNRVLREGITMMLNKEADVHVVAMIGSGNDILRKARDTKPHIILLDVGLKNYNELSVIKSMRENIPKAKVIGMGFIPLQTDIVEFVQAGAAGFILKDATIKEFLGTIRSVARGENIIPPTLTGTLFSHVIELAINRKKKSISTFVRMTKREREIIVLIADGLSNKEIASRLSIATYTVKSHVHNILEKLALHSRLQIAKHAHNDQIE